VNEVPSVLILKIVPCPWMPPLAATRPQLDSQWRLSPGSPGLVLVQVHGVDPKRRWIVAIVATPAAVACVAGLVGHLASSDADAPRLSVVRASRTNDRQVAVFRFSAPKARGVLIKDGEMRVSKPWTNPLPPGAEYPLQPFWKGGGPLCRFVREGESFEFNVAVPRECHEWQVKLAVAVAQRGLESIPHRLQRFWGSRDARALTSWDMFRPDLWVESDLVTNAAPVVARSLGP